MTMFQCYKSLTSVTIAGLSVLMLTSCQSLAQRPSGQQTSLSAQQNPQRLTQNQPGMGPRWGGGGGWRHHGSGGWGHRDHYGRMYDLNAIETIRGNVISVDMFTPGSGMSQGIHMQVNTGQETIAVHLGPAWYLENQDLTIEPNDEIELTGSRISFAGNPAIVASEVKKGDATLILRDENGFPNWSGWRRNN